MLAMSSHSPRWRTRSPSFDVRSTTKLPSRDHADCSSARALDARESSLQRIFPALADDTSLEQMLGGIAERARDLGYEKVWLVPALANEPLFAPALKVASEALGRPIVFVPTSGMAALQVVRRSATTVTGTTAAATSRGGR